MGIQVVTSVGASVGCYESLLHFASHCSSWSRIVKDDSNSKAKWCGGQYGLLTRVGWVSLLVRLRASVTCFFIIIYHTQEPNPHRAEPPSRDFEAEPGVLKHQFKITAIRTVTHS